MGFLSYNSTKIRKQISSLP